MSDRPRQAPAPDEIRCKGVKKSGERCSLPAAEGSEFCPYHGGGIRRSKGGAPKGTPQPPGAGGPPPKGSANAMSYGAYTTKMPGHLESLRQMYLERYVRAVANPDPFDLDALDRAAVLQAKFIFAAADADCPAVTLDVIHRTLHKELRALRATREMREQTSTGNSPAEVIARILVKVAERRRLLEEGLEIQAPQGRVLQHVPRALPRHRPPGQEQ